MMHISAWLALLVTNNTTLGVLAESEIGVKKLVWTQITSSSYFYLPYLHNTKKIIYSGYS